MLSAGPAGRHTERRAARLAAVQAIYQMELTGNDAESVAQEFCDHRFSGVDAASFGEPDADFFSDLVRGVPHHQVEIDSAIAAGLTERWKLHRIDSILRAILRAGIYELLARKDVPVKVVIDEYLDIAHAFFAGEEPSFVNALLDRVAHTKRAAEFGEPPPNDELRF
jgi:N utilization substance protein B